MKKSYVGGKKNEYAKSRIETTRQNSKHIFGEPLEIKIPYTEQGGEGAYTPSPRGTIEFRAPNRDLSGTIQFESFTPYPDSSRNTGEHDD